MDIRQQDYDEGYSDGLMSESSEFTQDIYYRTEELRKEKRALEGTEDRELDSRLYYYEGLLGLLEEAERGEDYGLEVYESLREETGFTEHEDLMNAIGDWWYSTKGYLIELPENATAQNRATWLLDRA